MTDQTFPQQQYTSIETEELNRLRARVAEMPRLPTPDYTGEGSAWVPPVEARAVVVPDYEIMADLAWRHHFDPLHGPTDMFAAGRTAMYKAMCAELRAIHADRVLGEGMVGVSREELTLYREWESEARDATDGDIWPDEAKILKRLDSLRANQGGADHA